MCTLIPGTASHVICLHGFSPSSPEEWRTAYKSIIEYFAKISIRPHNVTADDVTGQSNSTRSIASWERQVSSEAFPTPSALMIGSNLLPGVNLPWRFNDRAHALISTGLGNQPYSRDGPPRSADGGLLVFFCDAALMPDAQSNFDALAIKAWESLGFQYGYAWKFTHGREGTPMDFIYGNPARHISPEENMARKHWARFRAQVPEAHAYKAWLEGRQMNGSYSSCTPYTHALRDIYARNYLTDKHLSLEVGKKNLYEWITTSSSRGHLASISRGLWCWNTQNADVALLRTELSPSGILVSQQKNNEKKPNSPPSQ